MNDRQCFPGLWHYHLRLPLLTLKDFCVPAGSPFRGLGCYGLCFRHKPTELAGSFFLLFFKSVLVSVFVFMALSTVFHSVNSSHNSPLSVSVLLVSFLPLLALSTIYLFMKVSLSPDIILCGWLSLKHQLIPAVGSCGRRI